MRIHLVWLEPKRNWYERGYANHLHLFVDYKDKTYELVTSYGTGWNDKSLVEVKRKSDIHDYVNWLNHNGFKNKKGDDKNDSI